MVEDDVTKTTIVDICNSYLQPWDDEFINRDPRVMEVSDEIGRLVREGKELKKELKYM